MCVCVCACALVSAAGRITPARPQVGITGTILTLKKTGGSEKLTGLPKPTPHVRESGSELSLSNISAQALNHLEVRNMLPLGPTALGLQKHGLGWSEAEGLWPQALFSGN